MPERSSVELPRRAVVAAALGGVVALRVRPTAARAAAPPRELSGAELRTLVAWYEMLVPGAERAGVGDFVQEQLRQDERFSLLQLRYFNWPPPWIEFYRTGIASLDAASRVEGGGPFLSLPVSARRGMVAAAVAGRALPAWSEPPPLGLWVAATRGDAVDIVYARHGELAPDDMPMLQHAPPRW